ncbi:hypothetical protein HOLleu_16837 [Holothuria leucospilota]|uniref:Uncharacterized protein n=1 Tax=Holothuria leucospilota TaxID=206669 RepID=A0A9Q1HBH7_HOLLE|nr:hypothetical protein HOLleu_16837 [Holothuria leucospilota]
MAEEVTSSPLTQSDGNKTKQEMGGDRGTKGENKDGRTEDNGEVEETITSIKSITGSTEEELLAKLEAQNHKSRSKRLAFYADKNIPDMVGKFNLFQKKKKKKNSQYLPTRGKMF